MFHRMPWACTLTSPAIEPPTDDPPPTAYTRG